MARKSVIYCIFSDLVNAMKPVVGNKYIFLKDRPSFKEGDVPMSRFAVIDLPTSITDAVIGNRKVMLNTSGVIYLFVQARSNNTLDVNAMGDFIDSTIDTFPVKGTYCVATNPQLRMTGNDGQGFQVATITFDLRSRWGVFENT